MTTDPANPYLAPTTPAPRSGNAGRATTLRAVALGLYLLTVLWPFLSQSLRTGWGTAIATFAVYALATLALGVVLAAAAVASGHRVAAGVLLALGTIAAHLVQAFAWGGYGPYVFFDALIVAFPALSWAVSRPFRGPGYAALGGGVIASVVLPLLLSALEFGGGEFGFGVPWWVYSLLNVAVTVGTVMLAVYLERPRASTAKPSVLA